MPQKHPSTERLKKLASQIQNKKILVIGDIGVDSYLTGKVERISPEAPVPVLHVQKEHLKLGLAANVAENIQALGSEALCVGVVGTDLAGEELHKLFNQSGTPTHCLVKDPLRKTTLKTRVVAQNQQLIRIDQETTEPVSRYTEERILNQIRSNIDRVDALILEDYAKGMLSHRLCKAILGLAKEHQKIIAVDPNLKAPASYYIGATLLTPNTSEAEKLSDTKIKCEDTLRKAALKILKTTKAHSLVITRGKDGMAIFQKDAPMRLIPTFAKEVFDVSGAGDTVISVLTLCLASGASLYESAILANIAAGIEVSKLGTATVSHKELRAALTQF